MIIREAVALIGAIVQKEELTMGPLGREFVGGLLLAARDGLRDMGRYDAVAEIESIIRRLLRGEGVER